MGPHGVPVRCREIATQAEKRASAGGPRASRDGSMRSKSVAGGGDAPQSPGVAGEDGIPEATRVTRSARFTTAR